MTIRIDPACATCHVFTYKAGALAALGHDLVFRLERFSFALQDDVVEGHVEMDSLSLLGACVNETAPEYTAFGRKDAERIMKTAKEILEPTRFPTARLRLTHPALALRDGPLDAQLTWRGARRSVDGQMSVQGEEGLACFSIAQPAFGIRPFRAALGGLRIQPMVSVHVRFPLAPWNAAIRVE